MLRDLNRWEVDRPISPVEMSPPRRVEEMHSIDDEQILSSAPTKRTFGKQKFFFLFLDLIEGVLDSYFSNNLLVFGVDIWYNEI